MIPGSPLKILRIDFLRTAIEVNEKVDLESAQDYDFHSSMMRFAFEAGTNDDETVWLAVGFTTVADADDQLPCPYIIDMQAIGTFQWDQPIEPEASQKLLFEHGIGHVYGAIREMVATITSRSTKGTLVIPTPSFPELLAVAGSDNS